MSLSPASLRRLKAGERVLLPSPNGSRLSLATGDTPTICACFRNATAAAELAGRIAAGGVIGVIAAGERWPDSSLRPALEDMLGAGAVICACSATPNAEARFAADAYRAVGAKLRKLVSNSRSGRELADWGFPDDVALAIERDVTSAVPLLQSGVYQTAT